MQKVVSPGKFAFSDYELDVASRLLTRRGETVSIAPRALECLIYLIQHADRAVGRDELISAVWGRTDINYTVLTQTLWKLRRALNESSDADSQFIRTVSRFGYQWIAPQVPVPAPRADLEAAPSGPSRDSGTIPTTEPKSPVKRRWRKVAGWGAAAAVILALLILVPVPWQDQVQSPARDEVAAMAPQHGKRFLVLPARMDVSNPDDAWVNLGLMDYLATNLRRHDRLQVVGSDRVLSLLE